MAHENIIFEMRPEKSHPLSPIATPLVRPDLILTPLFVMSRSSGSKRSCSWRRWIQ